MSVPIFVSEGQVVVTRAMSVPIFVSEGQVVVTLALLLKVVVRIIVVGIVVAWAVVVASPEEILQTKEPSPGVPLVRGLSLPPAAVASSAVASTQQRAQEPGVSLPIVRLSLPSAAGVVVVVVSAIESSAEDSAAKETSAYTKESTINKAVTGADNSLVCVRLCVSISV